MSVASPSIRVRDLCKTYTVPERDAGAYAAMRSLVRRRTRAIHAVDGINFDVHPGEIVGFLGPNGAGKTTALKMLSGLLHPTSGQVEVLGHQPARREPSYLRQITLVMGQRSQMSWDLPAIDTFELNRVIYGVPPDQYRRTLSDITDLLELGPLLRKPVRNLSLGERMKVEVAVALIHQPRMLFLDEPTIGLDVTMQRRIRSFIAAYNQRHEATVLLTSHYMADVEALCRRVIVIHHGKLLFDGDLAGLVKRFAPHKTIVIDLKNGCADLNRYGEVLENEDGRITLRVPKADTARVTGRLLADLEVLDLTVEEPPIEDVIERLFAQAAP